MKKAVIIAGVLVMAVAALRRFGPALRDLAMRKCEQMFEQMPEDFPPKRMMRGIEETRVNTARTLELLEASEQAGESEALGEASSTREVSHAA